MWELRKPNEAAGRPEGSETVHLGQTSLSDALATGRTLQRTPEAERDPYAAWEIFFKTVGLVAVLGGLLLLVFVLVA
jgi:hypothetical protein